MLVLVVLLGDILVVLVGDVLVVLLGDILVVLVGDVLVVLVGDVTFFSREELDWMDSELPPLEEDEVLEGESEGTVPGGDST